MALHQARSCNVFLTMELAADDRSTDSSRGIDDFFDSWDTLRDTHASNTSEMKGFQSHLRSRFTNRLRGDGSDSSPWLHFGFIVLFQTRPNERY